MIFDCESIPEFLNSELRRRIQSNSQYSLRAFAKSLNMSPGAVSEILRGQRQLGPKAVDKVAKAVGLNNSETKFLHELAMSQRVQFEERSGDQASTKLLEEDVFSLVSEWYHFAILNLIDVEGFCWQAGWISNRLGITKIQASLAMELLEKLEIVTLKGDRVIADASHVTSTNEIPSQAIKNYHRQMLSKAAEALESQGIGERDVSGIGFAVDPRRIPKLKREIMAFQDEVLEKYSSGKKSEVYFLEMALFRLTQGEKK